MVVDALASRPRLKPRNATVTIHPPSTAPLGAILTKLSR